MDENETLTAALPPEALSFVVPGVPPEWLAAEMAAKHAPVNGQHSHAHPTYKSQGSDSTHDHLHHHGSSDGPDANHNHDHSMSIPTVSADGGAWTAAGFPDLDALLAAAHAAAPEGTSLVAAAMSALGSPWGLEERDDAWAVLGRDGDAGTYATRAEAIAELATRAFADGQSRPVLAETWRSEMAFEGVNTPDGRYIDPGGLAYRDCPMPLMLQTTTDVGHFGAVLAGTIMQCGTVNQTAMGSGEFDDTEAGRQFLQIVQARDRFGVSIDGMSPAEAEYECTDRDEDGWCTDGRVVFHLLTQGGLTGTPFPAFPDAYIALEQRAQAAAGDPADPEDETASGDPETPCEECAETHAEEEAARAAHAATAGGHTAAGKEDPDPTGKAATIPFTAASNTHRGSMVGCQCAKCVASATSDPATTAAASANRATDSASPTGSPHRNARTATGSSQRTDADPSDAAMSAAPARPNAGQMPVTASDGSTLRSSDGTPNHTGSTDTARMADGSLTSPTTGRPLASSSTAPQPNNSSPSRTASAPSVASSSPFSPAAWEPSRAPISTMTTDGSGSEPGSAHPATVASAASSTRPNGSGRRPTTSTGSLTSAGEFAHLLAPPAEWFGDPKFAINDGRVVPQPGGGHGCPLSVTAQGEVYGHMATWQNCHTGYHNACVTPPRSKTGYAAFMLRPLMLADGTVAHVGHLTMGCGHASTAGRLGIDDVRAHYDGGPGAVRIAQVCVGEDKFGIWFHGSVDPAATPEQVREFAALSVSGDWREVWRGKGLDLVACLAGVTVPGFPVASALAAAGLRVVAADEGTVLPSEPIALFTDGRPSALVAAGVVRRPMPWQAADAAQQHRIDTLEARLAAVERVANRLRPLAADALLQTLTPGGDVVTVPASNGHGG